MPYHLEPSTCFMEGTTQSTCFLLLTQITVSLVLQNTAICVVSVAKTKNYYYLSIENYYRAVDVTILTAKILIFLREGLKL